MCLKIIRFVLIISFLVICEPSPAQPQIYFKEISVTDLNVRGAPVVVDQIDINIPTWGNVLVHFNGECLSDFGDRIILAASNDVYWDINDAHTSCEAIDADINRVSFSHTRMYTVSAGINTFYAIAHNFIETQGSGQISLNGSLTVKFLPEMTDEPFVRHVGISRTFINVRGEAKSIGELNVEANIPGNFLVRFDGYCMPDVGDKIVLAASDTVGWQPGDGRVTTEALSYDFEERPFSHTRVYPVADGNYTFYAVAENIEEQEGAGNPSIYASLTVEYFPDINNKAIVQHQGISVSGVYVRGNPVTVGQLGLDIPENGVVLVHFDGECVSDVGDKIILAASNNNNWGEDAGKVSVEAISEDINQNSFSHTRYYEVEAGNHNFYAVVENIDELDGNGIVSIHGSLTLEFFPGLASNVQTSDDIPVRYSLMQNYPNPFNPETTIDFELPADGITSLVIYDLKGQVVASLVNERLSAGKHSTKWNAGNYASGIYFYQLKSASCLLTKKMLLLK